MAERKRVRRAPGAPAVAVAVAIAAAAPLPVAAQFHDEGGGWRESDTPSRPAARPQRAGPRAGPEPREATPPRTSPADRRRAEPAPPVWPGGEAAAEPAKPAVPVPPPEPPRPPLAGRKALVVFEASPFPYDGPVPPDGKPFLDVTSETGRRGRQSPRTGTTLWADETYSDRRVLLYVPKGFTLAKPPVLVLFFHGNGTRLGRDVERRQAVLHQVEAARINAVVVAPQLAFDAQDSSPGGFWRPGMLATFLEEAAVELAALVPPRKPPPDKSPSGKPSPGRTAVARPVDVFRHAPIVVVAYSGGYAPAAWALHHGGADERIAGVVVLDGMYGEQAKFADWIERRRDAFLLTAYGPSSQEGSMELRRLLGERETRQLARLDGSLPRGSVTFLAVAGEVKHHDFVTQAWIKDPLTDVLKRLPPPR